MKKLLIVMSVFTMLLVSCTQPVQEEIPEPSIVTIEDSNQVSEENKSEENKPEEKSEEPTVEEVVQESSDTDDKELVEEPVQEEKSEEPLEEKSEEPVIEEPIVEELVQEEIVEEPIEEPAIEELVVEEPVVEESAEEPVVEEPIEDTWVEVHCFDETYGMDYIIFPEELDVTSGYIFENNTEPDNNNYQLFKFEYVKSLVLNDENNAQYVLNGEVKTTDNCYHTVKCYKLYLNTKYTGDELVIVYPNIYVTNNWMKYSLGYHVEKIDDDYSLKLAFYNGYRNKVYTSENDTNENLKIKRTLLLSYYEENISE